MSRGYCKTCGRHSYELSEHVCPPAYEVILGELGEDWEDARTVYAESHKAAAEEAVEQANASAAEDVSREKVEVRKRGESAFFVFTVYVDYCPQYTAVATTPPREGVSV